LVVFSIEALRRKLVWLVVGIVFLDLGIFNSRYVFTIPREVISLKSEVSKELLEIMTPQDRFVSYQDIEPFTGLGNYWENMTLLPPFAQSFYVGEEKKSATILNKRIADLALNWNLTHGLVSPNGYASFLLKDYWAFISGEGETRLNNLEMGKVSEEKLDQLSVSFNLGREGIERREKALSRARVVDSEERLVGAGEIMVNEPERVVVKVSSEEPARLVLADSFYPGWEVKVNGREASISKYQEVFRSVSLPEGEQVVEFSFRPRTVYLGGLVSLVTIGVMAIMLKSRKLFV
jgi:hypothetical protein